MRSILKNGSHITDEVIVENMYELNQLYLTKTAITLAYTIPLNTNLASNYHATLIRCSDPTLGNNSSVFNALKFIFKINQDTPLNQELELQFLVKHSHSNTHMSDRNHVFFKVPSTALDSDSDSDSYVQLQSISENFPSVSDKL